MLVDLGAVDPDGVADALDDILTQQLASHEGVRQGLYRHRPTRPPRHRCTADGARRARDRRYAV